MTKNTVTLPTTSELQTKISSSLTVLIHGAVNLATINPVLESINMWRRAYPRAELHFCASMLGDIDKEAQASSQRSPENLPHLDEEQQRLGRQLRAAVDHFSVAPYQAPLPTLKYDSGPNNCNRMIAAARRGLRDVRTRYVLRCRYDLYLDNINACLTDYALLAQKGLKPTLFKWPVAVSPYFTLNPLLLEKLPYHVSDWFHFGLTEDITSLWDVDFFPLRDAQFYQMYPHAVHSGYIERLFRARLSPEQYLFNALAVKRGYPELKYHNEPGHDDCFFDLLRRNFVIVDHKAVGMTMQKYDRVKEWVQSDYQSIDHDQWQKLVCLGTKTWRRRLWQKRIAVGFYRNFRPRLIYRRMKRSKIIRSALWLR